MSEMMIAALLILGCVGIGHVLGERKSKHNGLQIAGAIALFVVILWTCGGGAKIAAQLAAILHH